MSDALIWWAAIEVVGIAAFPIAFILFPALPDRGYSLAKPLGLLLVTYGLWVAGLTHAMPNTRVSIVLILVGLAAVSAFFLLRHRSRFSAYFKERWMVILL